MRAIFAILLALTFPSTGRFFGYEIASVECETGRKHVLLAHARPETSNDFLKEAERFWFLTTWANVKRPDDASNLHFAHRSETGRFKSVRYESKRCTASSEVTWRPMRPANTSGPSLFHVSDESILGASAISSDALRSKSTDDPRFGLRTSDIPRVETRTDPLLEGWMSEGVPFARETSRSQDRLKTPCFGESCGGWRRCHYPSGKCRASVGVGSCRTPFVLRRIGAKKPETIGEWLATRGYKTVGGWRHDGKARLLPRGRYETSFSATLDVTTAERRSWASECTSQPEVLSQHYEFELLTVSSVRVDLNVTGRSWKPVLALRAREGGCVSVLNGALMTGDSCSADEATGWPKSGVSLRSVLSAGVYVLLVHGFGPSDAGSFDLKFVSFPYVAFNASFASTHRVKREISPSPTREVYRFTRQHRNPRAEEASVVFYVLEERNATTRCRTFQPGRNPLSRVEGKAYVLSFTWKHDERSTQHLASSATRHDPCVGDPNGSKISRSGERQRRLNACCASVGCFEKDWISGAHWQTKTREGEHFTRLLLDAAEAKEALDYFRNVGCNWTFYV